MINFFNFAVNDQSLCYLGQIFGDMGGIITLPAGTTCQTVPGSTTLLGTMFQTFNATVLTVGVLIVVYTTVLGVLATAHEGQFMGKNMNNLWIPIRTVLGIAALVPSTTGYSFLQMLMMWVIIQGIGAADTLWNTALNFVDKAGSPYAQGVSPGLGASTSLNSLFQMMVCDAGARMTTDNPYVSGLAQGGYFCALNSNNSFCGSQPAQFDSSGSTITYQFGPNAACGRLTVCNKNLNCTANPKNPSDTTVGPSSLACVACTAQLSAMATIFPTMQSMASQFVQTDYAYVSYVVQSMINKSKAKAPDFVQSYCSASGIGSCDGSSLPNPSAGQPNAPTSVVSNIYWPYAFANDAQTNFMGTITAQYQKTISDAVNAFLTQQGQNSSQNNNIRNQTLKEAGDYGWILAGGYYYAIANMVSNNLAAATPALTVSPTDPESNQNNVLRGMRHNFTAATAMVAASSNASSGGSTLSSSDHPQLGQATDAMSETVNDVNNTFKQNLSHAANPLYALMVTGQVLLAVAQVLFVTFLLISAFMSIGGFLDVYVLGTGVSNPVGPTWATLTLLIVPLFLGLEGILISAGGAMSVYIPLIPYVIFTMGAISWLLTTIETMVAGPIVALGILNPGGRHEFLGKAEPALMLIFNVFMRPSLMIFGLMSAMLLANVVLQMINMAFWNLLNQTQAGNPLWNILFLVAYVFLIIAALNKCFGAISAIPNTVMEWMGGSRMRDAGEEQAMGKVEGGVSAGGGKATGAVGATHDTEKGRRDRGGKQKAKDEEAAAQAKLKPKND